MGKGEKIIFPQANDIYKVIDLVELVKYDKTPSEIKTTLGLTTNRQIHYYLSALEFLGFFKYKGLTELGHELYFSNTESRIKMVVEKILGEDVFNDYYEFRDDTRVVHKLCSIYSLSLSTAKRRLSTVKKWVKWIDIVVNDYKLTVKRGEVMELNDLILNDILGESYKTVVFEDEYRKTYKVIDDLGDKTKDNVKRVSVVRWKKQPQTTFYIDIRNYSKSEAKYKKGISLTFDEAKQLMQLLNDFVFTSFD